MANCSDSTANWWQRLPKVELHAHLNGSIRDTTLLELARELGEKGNVVFSDVEQVILKNDRSLVEVFKLFDLIHLITTDHKTVTRITKEVVEDFAADNVVYLELRTTPKRNDTRGMSKESYLQAVVEGLKTVKNVHVDFGQKVDAETAECSHPNTDICRKKIYVRLLLSIDRRESTEAAMETVKLAIKMKSAGVVGIDLSGNPIVGEWSTFLPALKYAKEEGVSVTLHCGEVPNAEEVHAMIDFVPGRIGHACFLEEEHWQKLKLYKIPVEICLTSNIKTETIPSLDLHHFADLYSSRHPMTLCTDDSGVFSTSLSNEFNLASSTFGIGKKEMFEFARETINFIFAGDGVKERLKEMFASSNVGLRD